MSGRIVHPNAEEVVDTTFSDAYAPLGGDTIGVSIDVTAVSSGTLNVEVEWSPDGDSDNFGAADSSADTFTEFTTAITLSKQFTVKAPFYRLKYAVAIDAVSFTAAVYG